MKKILLLLPIIALLNSCGFEIVDDGYVGIKRTMGKVETEEYKPGIHFYNPITTGIFEMEVREKKWSSETASYSSDNQIIKANFQVNYKPVASQMAELFIGQGEDYIEIILPQRVKASIKDVLGEYKATNLTQVREKVNDEVTALIRKRLEGTNVTLVDFEITDFDYDDDFEAAVKAKIVAKERAIEEQNRTVQVQEKANQRLISAKAAAEEIKIKAEALSKNKDLIQLEAVKKWDGKLPTMTMGGGALPFINVTPKK